MTELMQTYLARIQTVLTDVLSNPDVPQRLGESMRYSTLSSGKRVRGLLVYASGMATGAPLERLDNIAAALECIHAYSLIHDDLPAMDDDDLRRGQPTNHIQYDEATAILAGDALQTLAFELICGTESGLSDTQTRAITLKLAQASGPQGMVGGQMLDILATEQSLNQSELENVHRRKTGALINAAVICGALASDDCSESQLDLLSQYADHIGLAFQVIDDVLDVESTTAELGKVSGADQAMGKSTFPALIGLQASKNLAQKLYQRAVDCIAAIGDNSALIDGDLAHSNQHENCSMLLDIAALIIDRKH